MINRATRYLQATSLSLFSVVSIWSLPWNPALLPLISPCAAIPRIDSPIPAVAAESEEECVVVSGEFGIVSGRVSDLVDKYGNKPGHFTATSIVPLTIGQIYGWRIHVTPDDAKVHWKEEFTLPAVPKSWSGINKTDSPSGADKQQALEKGGKVCISERDVTATDGSVSNLWSVIKGDPPGLYKMRVWINGTLTKTFEFQVKPVAPIKLDGARKKKDPPTKAK